MRRKIKGTNLVLVGGKGYYITEDGRYEVAYEDDYQTMCDEPHPVKLPRSEWKWERYWPSDPNKPSYMRQVKGYQCPGSEEHTYGQWHVWDTQVGDFACGGERYDTLTAAAESLARELNKQDDQRA